MAYLPRMLRGAAAPAAILDGESCARPIAVRGAVFNGPVSLLARELFES
jgi:hypothetical protein